METISLSKKEYSELIRVKDIIEKILSSAKEKRISKKDNFLEAFGILKNGFNEKSENNFSEIKREGQES